MRATIRETHIISRRQRIIIGLLTVGLTLAGVVAYTNWFSFLMLLLLGVPGLLALLDALTDDAG
jgi:hypothetical protein